jgi:hypothetical protein
MASEKDGDTSGNPENTKKRRFFHGGQYVTSVSVTTKLIPAVENRVAYQSHIALNNHHAGNASRLSRCLVRAALLYVS